MTVRECLTRSRYIFGCHKWKNDATGTKVVEARHAAKHSAMHRTVPHKKELPKAQAMSIPLRLRNAAIRIGQIETK